MSRRHLFILAALVWAEPAAAEDVRVHVAAGAAHAVGKQQGSEFGAGGGGSASIELPVGDVVGIEATGGGLVLSSSDSPSESGVAKQNTGTAFLGTLGARVRPFGARRVAGPWVSGGAGLAQTGSLSRAAVDARLGWDFRVSKEGRWDVGPFVGYTQVVQPDDSFRGGDARILWAGLSVSLGANPRRPAPAPKAVEPPPPPPPVDHDGLAESIDVCPDPTTLTSDSKVPEGCRGPEVQLVGDRIVIDDVIHFEFGSPRIRHTSHGLVQRIANFIVEHGEILEVKIEGHADAVGTEEYNQQLSEARAESTREMLILYGVPRARLQAVGYGKSRLKIETQSAEEQNRRVEFIVSQSRPVPAPKRATEDSAGTRGPAAVNATGKRSQP